MRVMMRLTAEQLRELLDYDSETGVFRWRGARGRSKAGSVAGHVRKDGYRLIQVDGRIYMASRLAWFYATGKCPKGDIDHKNGSHDDNRVENLRDVSHSENQQNQRRARKDSITGLLGSSPLRGKFQATIKVNGKSRHLGLFITAEGASAAYIEAKRRLHPGCTL